MTIELELQIASNIKTLPHPAQIREWISIVFWKRMKNAELTIRIVDTQEMTTLNDKFRQKKEPTNVLAFPIRFEHEDDAPLLGDIIICAPVVEQEATEQDKELLAHWAHMVIHGALHLLNYNHHTIKDAITMEKLETQLLTKLGFANPYEEQS